MSTHAGIGIQDADGSVRAIYCHHDGYPEHVGKVLVEHFATRERVEELLALGSLNALGRDGTLRHYPDAGLFEDHGTDAYHRDQGESWTDSAPVFFAGPMQYHAMVGYEHEYLWLLATDDGPEGWYKWAGGGWSPLVGMRTA